MFLAASFSAFTACAGERAEESRPPTERPDSQTAVAAGDARTPQADADEASGARPRSDGTSSGAASDEVMSGPRSDMSRAVRSAPSTPISDADKSYFIPAIEIVGYEALLNQYDRHNVDHDVYGTTNDSIHENLRHGWVVDKDPFAMNQFGHPYSGSLYHGFARSAGLNYWEALGYDFAGSALWEVAGETDPPSLNDQITTTFAGSFLGEALFRTAALVLQGGHGKPSTGRSVLAGLIAPSAAVNRLAFGKRFDAAYPDDDPAVFYWLGGGVRRNTTLKDVGGLSDVKKDAAVAAFALDYGLPGQPGYEYKKPFDYFHFEATATTNENAIPENIMVRGLLYGKDTSSGRDYSGIWGLYGTYDYFSPELFKVSSTALSLGTTGQYLMSDKWALQGTGLGGLGFTAAGENDNGAGDREYRYGASPQALLTLRLIYGDVAMFGVTANDFLIVGSSGSASTSSNENIMRMQLSLTVRIYERHAVGIQFIDSRRDRSYSSIPDPRQSVGALTIFYMYLGDEHFGVVGR
jgi:hypothetical protein